MASAAQNDAPKRLRPYLLGRLTEEQDSALDRATDALTRQRGNRVTRADVMREALARFFREHGLDWPC